MISQAQLKVLINYNPVSGKFIWRTRPGSTRWAGKQAGSTTTQGYIGIKINQKYYKAHRLAYLYMTGKWPEHEIDHIEGNRADNRWHMLRPATRKEQLRNAGIRTDNTSGVVGVSWVKQRKKWLAQIQIGGLDKNLGRFKTKEEAIAAREAANEKYGFHSNHGKRTGYRS